MTKLRKAFMSLLLDKKAREALETAAVAKHTPDHRAQSHDVPKTLNFPPDEDLSQDDIKARLDARLDHVNTQASSPNALSRKELIQNAMSVRAKKQTVLDDLSEEQRQKLQVLAMKAMMPPSSGKK